MTGYYIGNIVFIRRYKIKQVDLNSKNIQEMRQVLVYNFQAPPDQLMHRILKKCYVSVVVVFLEQTKWPTGAQDIATLGVLSM